MHKIVNGIKVDLTAEEIRDIESERAINIAKREEYERTKAYKDKRKAEYPNAEVQLEMIYNDKVNSTNTWVDAIAAINDKYPKPKL